MFEITSKGQDEITITTKQTTVAFNVAENEIDAGLKVGKIHGPGEFEIGDVTIRGIDVVAATRKEDGAKKVSGASKDAKKTAEDAEASGVTEGSADSGVSEALAEKKSGETIYDVEIGGVHVAIIGGDEQALDEIPQGCILCTSSVRAVREVEPKVVIAMGNIDGMVTELKLSARTEKKYKVKNLASLPMSLEVVALS